MPGDSDWIAVDFNDLTADGRVVVRTSRLRGIPGNGRVGEAIDVRDVAEGCSDTLSAVVDEVRGNRTYLRIDPTSDPDYICPEVLRERAARTGGASVASSKPRVVRPYRFTHNCGRHELLWKRGPWRLYLETRHGLPLQASLINVRTWRIRVLGRWCSDA